MAAFPRAVFVVLFLGPAALLACNDLEQAVQEEADKRRGDDLVAEGVKAYEAGNYTEAIEKLEKGVGLGLKYKNLDDVETIIGNAFLELDEYDRSIEHHQKALKHNPENYRAMVNLGATLRQKGDLDGAEKMYLQAAKRAPDYPELHASLGALYVYKEQYEKAEESLRHALKLEPKLAVGHANLALTLAKLGRFDEADTELERAVELGYKNAPLLREQMDVAREGQAVVEGSAGLSEAEARARASELAREAFSKGKHRGADGEIVATPDFAPERFRAEREGETWVLTDEPPAGAFAVVRFGPNGEDPKVRTGFATH